MTPSRSQKACNASGVADWRSTAASCWISAAMGETCRQKGQKMLSEIVSYAIRSSRTCYLPVLQLAQPAALRHYLLLLTRRLTAPQAASVSGTLTATEQRPTSSIWSRSSSRSQDTSFNSKRKQKWQGVKDVLCGLHLQTQDSFWHHTCSVPTSVPGGALCLRPPRACSTCVSFWYHSPPESPFVDETCCSLGDLGWSGKAEGGCR